MKTVGIKDLPVAPHANKGWPWTEDSGNWAETRLEDKKNLPSISIVVCSYNQGQYLEQAIRSVLLQGYPNLECLVVDGASTDNSIEIIKKYEPWLRYWVSEPDRGQSHALNKGFSKATGTIFGWLCSDDYLCKEALGKVANAYFEKNYPVMWVGSARLIDLINNTNERKDPQLEFSPTEGLWGKEFYISQPSTFFSAKTFREVGGLNESLHNALDLDLWIRLSKQGSITRVTGELSELRLYPEIKTFRDKNRRMAENIAVYINNDLPDLAEKSLFRSKVNISPTVEGWDIINQIPLKTLVLYLMFRFPVRFFKELLKMLIRKSR
jgi:glycosyltransferase involved in cell wall biosynthesis